MSAAKADLLGPRTWLNSSEKLMTRLAPRTTQEPTPYAPPLGCPQDLFAGIHFHEYFASLELNITRPARILSLLRVRASISFRSSAR